MGAISDKVLAFIEDKVGKWKYSKTLRMADGYADCSSIVYRAYKALGITLTHRTSGKAVSTSCYEVYAKQFQLIWPATYADIGKKLPTAASLLPSLNLQGGEHVFYCMNSKTDRANKITHIATVRKGGMQIVAARNPKVDICFNSITYGDTCVCAVVRYIEPETVPTPVPVPVPIPAKVMLARILKFGCKGQDVIELQKVLNAFGYGLSEDGKYGLKTRSAVIKFQKVHGLTADGKVGKETAPVLGFVWIGK